jgi:hypothetical protein
MHSASIIALSMALAFELSAQEPDDPQRITLLGLRTIATHAQVRVAQRSTLEPVDEELLRIKLEQAVLQEGMIVQKPADVRDGSAAQISLVYVVISMGDDSGRETRFAASSCLHASQYVRIPRLERGGRIAYTVAPTWSSCGIVAGDTGSYRDAILLNADEQIARFLSAWRSVNAPRPPPPVLSQPGLGLGEGTTNKLTLANERRRSESNRRMEVLQFSQSFCGSFHFFRSCDRQG